VWYIIITRDKENKGDKKMTVNELIELLYQYNENDSVVIVGNGDGAELQIGTYRQNIVNNKNYPLFILKDSISF